MTVSVFVELTNGQFCASLVGSPEICCVRPSRQEAIDALQDELLKKVADGELLSLEIQPLGVSGLSGSFRDDLTLREIAADIYRERDADKPS